MILLCTITGNNINKERRLFCSEQSPQNTRPWQFPFLSPLGASLTYPCARGFSASPPPALLPKPKTRAHLVLPLVGNFPGKIHLKNGILTCFLYVSLLLHNIIPINLLRTWIPTIIYCTNFRKFRNLSQGGKILAIGRIIRWAVIPGQVILYLINWYVWLT